MLTSVAKNSIHEQTNISHALLIIIEYHSHKKVQILKIYLTKMSDIPETMMAVVVHGKGK